MGLGTGTSALPKKRAPGTPIPHLMKSCYSKQEEADTRGEADMWPADMWPADTWPYVRGAVPPVLPKPRLQ